MVSPTAGEQSPQGWGLDRGGGGQDGRRGQVRCGWAGGGGVTLPSTQCLKASEEKAVERTDDADGREGVTECVRNYACPSVIDMTVKCEGL